MSKQALFPIANIRTPDRLRAVDQEWAKVIAVSVAEIGKDKQHEGMVQPVALKVHGKDGSAELVDGAHRLEAARMLGWDEIPFIAVSGSDLEIRLQQIDANLISNKLNALDRAVFLAERKAIYEALHPETKQGKAGAEARWHATAKIAFASETAEKAGISERSVYLALQIMKIVPDVREKLVGTDWADSQKDLLDLAKCGPELQRKVLKIMLRATDQVDSVADAIAEAEGRRVPEKDPVATVLAKWGRFDKRTRTSIYKQLFEQGDMDDFLRR